MTLEQLNTSLLSLGYPVAYRQFVEGSNPSLPFLVYLFTNASDLAADNVNYAGISNIDIELYADKKDLSVEAEVEDLLKSLELVYEHIEDWIPSEKMLRQTYSVRLVGSQES